MIAPGRPVRVQTGRGNIAVRCKKLKGCGRSRIIKVYMRRRAGEA
jgi:hypothetical protein